MYGHLFSRKSFLAAQTSLRRYLVNILTLVRNLSCTVWTSPVNWQVTSCADLMTKFTCSSFVYLIEKLVHVFKVVFYAFAFTLHWRVPCVQQSEEKQNKHQTHLFTCSVVYTANQQLQPNLKYEV